MDSSHEHDAMRGICKKQTIGPTTRQPSSEEKARGYFLPKPSALVTRGEGEQKEGRRLRPGPPPCLMSPDSRSGPHEVGGGVARCPVRDLSPALTLSDWYVTEAGSELPADSNPRASPVSPGIPSRYNVLKRGLLAPPLGDCSGRPSHSVCPGRGDDGITCACLFSGLCEERSQEWTVTVLKACQQP